MILLCILILIELGFCIWNITKADYHKSAKQAASLLLLLLFTILSVTGVLEWGFRYYALAIVLTAQAVYSVIALLRRYRKEKTGEEQGARRPFRYGKCIWRFVGKSILYTTSLTLAILCPQYKLVEQTGEYKVATQTATYEDAGRQETYSDSPKNRTVNVEFWYPQNGADDCPLMIFSHGAYGIRQSNESLFRELASHGYVVCSIDHPYHSFFTVSENGETAVVSMEYMQQYAEANAGTDINMLYEYIQEWMRIRCGDMDFVLNTIKEGAQASGQTSELGRIYQMIDTDTVIAAGHSMGGAAAASLGRTRDDIVCAVILEAPYFGDITGISGDEFTWTEEDYPIPVLNIYSDTAWGHFEESIVYEQNRIMFEEKSEECQSVHLEGTRHLGLTDLSLFCPIAAETLDGGSGGRDAHEVLEELNGIVLSFVGKYAQ